MIDQETYLQPLPGNMIKGKIFQDTNASQLPGPTTIQPNTNPIPTTAATGNGISGPQGRNRLVGRAKAQTGRNKGRRYIQPKNRAPGLAIDIASTIPLDTPSVKSRINTTLC
ncbi:hypothetical protein BDW42DRAFT_170315 [Aspergillus taichungensis]|uniref:Uncharacterized protein n=1 Tax=Aspergillus taichungensis TaxID=482145 RepID=A0A2J5HTP7_9EURO|nr:hypothetical protein BDW42DRAFT_170315 [Aspergillus taichungensis]